MRTRIGMLAVTLLSGCGADAVPEDWEPPEEASQALFSYSPMGFARVARSGLLTTSFNSTGGAVTVRRIGLGSYEVTFRGLGGYYGSNPSQRGNVQLVSEGTSSAVCDLRSWRGSGADLIVPVVCHIASNRADSPFAVQFFRYLMPAPNSYPTAAAYMTAGGPVSANIQPSADYDYNSSGTRNNAIRTGKGKYRAYIANAHAGNASLMVSAVGSTGTVSGAIVDFPLTCAIKSWRPASDSTLPGYGQVDVACHDLGGLPADGLFTLSYSTTGPTMDQQGAHARFNGTTVQPSYTSSQAKFAACSAASVTGSLSDSLASVVVSGELGSFDGGPFLRASFVTSFGNPGYCKVERVSNGGVPQALFAGHPRRAAVTCRPRRSDPRLRAAREPYRVRFKPPGEQDGGHPALRGAAEAVGS